MSDGPVIGGLPSANYEVGPRDNVKPDIVGRSANRNVVERSPQKYIALLDNTSTTFRKARAFYNHTLAERQVSSIKNITPLLPPSTYNPQQAVAETLPRDELMAAQSLVTQAPAYKVAPEPEQIIDNSSLDLNNNPFLISDGKQLRTSAAKDAMTSTSKKRRSSLGDIAKQVSMSNKIARAFGKQGLSSQVLIGMEKVAAYENQGIPRNYLENFQKVAEQENTIIAVRPVEMICRTLIEEGYESKGLNIKGKSSNWGPMAGFIPVDQAYSKLADTPEKVPAYNEKNHNSINVQGTAKQEQLHISSTRIEELTQLGMINNSRSAPPDSGYTKAFCFESSSKGGLTKTFEAHQKPDGQWDIFTGTDHSKKQLMVIPKTADFDLLFCFSSTESTDLAGMDKKRGFDSELGVLSDRTKNTIDALNTTFNRGEGKNMVHHGADTENPVTEMEANFPSTIFFPLGIRQHLGIYRESPILIKNEEELMKLFRAMQSAGFNIKANPLWDKMTEVVKEKFQALIASYEKKDNHSDR